MARRGPSTPRLTCSSPSSSTRSSAPSSGSADGASVHPESPPSLRFRRGPCQAGLVRSAEYGGIVWLTGLSGAGKSTLASALAARFSPVRAVELLDGDEVRAFLSK